LLVEGWAEKAFLDKLRESHFSHFLDLLVECYDGKGNRRSKRIAMLLGRYVELGYTIYAQGDADGKPGEIFRALVEAGHLKAENNFVFSFDFETAVPVPLLVRAMRRIGLTLKFKPHELQDALKAAPASVNDVLRDKFGVDLEPDKIELAVAVAEILNVRQWVWWKDEEFMKTELGKFLFFIQRMG
jgi:hypothetical protein